MMDLTLQPMSISQILDRTFQLYRRNFLLFAGIAALLPALLLILQALGLAGQQAVPAIVQSPRAGSPFPFTPSMIWSLIGVGFFFVLVLILGNALTTGATVYAVSRVHLGKTSTIGESYRRIGRFVAYIALIGIIAFLFAALLFLAAYVVGILVFAVLIGLLGAAMGSIGTIIGVVLGVPVVIAALVWAFLVASRLGLAVPSCVIEKLGPFDSISRSWSLAKDSAWRILLTYFLAGVIGLTLSLVLSIPEYIAAGMSAGKPPLPFQIWGILASFLAGTIAGPIGTIAISLIYYDQRVRKEAFDLHLMMEAIGQPLPPPAATSAGIG